MSKEKDPIDLHSFKVDKWLHELWSPAFWGWTLSSSETEEALILRVPDFYYVGSKKVYTSEESKYFNMIRLPLFCKHCEKNHDMTVTFDFMKSKSLVWDKDVDFFKRNERAIKESLANFPKYFYILEQLELGTQNAHRVKDVCEDIFDLWEW